VRDYYMNYCWRHLLLVAQHNAFNNRSPRQRETTRQASAPKGMVWLAVCVSRLSGSYERKKGERERNNWLWVDRHGTEMREDYWPPNKKVLN
jgi:hypothetical protein